MTDEPMTDTPPATTTSPPVKPGWQTTEFWFSTAAVALTALFASGALTNSVALAIAGMAATVLTALGYKVSRTMVKVAGALLLVLVIGGAALTTACATARPRATAGYGALLDCTAPARAPVVHDLGVALQDYARRYISGDGKTIDLAKLKADALALKGEVLGSCGLVTALAILATPKAEAARSLLAEPGPEQWREALEVVRAELGVGAVRAAG